MLARCSMPDALPSGRCTIPITTAIKLPSPPCCVVCVCARECESEKDRDMVVQGKLSLPTSPSALDQQVVTQHVRLAPVRPHVLCVKSVAERRIQVASGKVHEMTRCMRDSGA